MSIGEKIFFSEYQDPEYRARYLRENKMYSHIYFDFMTSGEYMEYCAVIRHDYHVNPLLALQREYAMLVPKLVSKYARLMKKGERFYMPNIDWHFRSQEGRHRAMAFARLFGPDERFPVLIKS